MNVSIPDRTMPASRLLPGALALLLAASPAFAQLKAPKNAPAASPALAPAASAPAPAPAPVAAADPNEEKINAARLAAAGWLSLLDRRDWGTAWEASSTTFRKTVPIESWMEAAPKVRAPFGPLQERDAVDATYKTTLAGQPAGEYVSIVFQARYAQRTVAEVVTTVLDKDGRWRVTGYSPR